MSVAKSYAKALLEFALESGFTPDQCQRIELQLHSLVELVDGSKSLGMALYGPATTSKEKISVVQMLAQKLGMEPVAARFLELMARKRRLDLLEMVAQSYRELRLEHDGIILGELYSADPLSRTDIDDLSSAFAKRIGKKIHFDAFEDPSLLAGVKVKVNGVTYDGTLRSQLNRLKETLVHSPAALSN